MNRCAVFGLAVAGLAVGVSCASVVVTETGAGATSGAVTSSVSTSGAGSSEGVGTTGAGGKGAGGSTGNVAASNGAGGTGGTGGTPEVAVPDQVVAYQIDAAHTGAQSDETLLPPLTQRWSVDLAGTVSYPLIAEGKVFVTVGNKPLPGSRLYALDKETGATAWGPVDLAGLSGGSHATYASGRVFVQTSVGLLCAYDAGTGAQIWCLQLVKNMGLYDAPPTAFGGKVYVSGAVSITAVSQASGQVLWTSPVFDGARSAPVVSSAGVFDSYNCFASYGFNPATGAKLWENAPVMPGCSGAGTSVLYEGVLYARASLKLAGRALDAATGAKIGDLYTTRTPAFHGGHGFFVDGEVLTARSAPSLMDTWTFTASSDLSMAPLVANNHVYVASVGGLLYALSELTGAVTWSTDVGEKLPSIENDSLSEPLPGLGIGGGALIVPANHHLLAYW
jgi:outer membrane protein assembly factor BamB